MVFQKDLVILTTLIYLLVQVLRTFLDISEVAGRSLWSNTLIVGLLDPKLRFGQGTGNRESRKLLDITFLVFYRQGFVDV